MATKNYEVEVRSNRSHGKYGKVTHFVLVLEASSKKRAEEFAHDVLDGMTYAEVAREFDNKFSAGAFLYHAKQRHALRQGVCANDCDFDENAVIGTEDVDHFFSFKASVA